MTDKQVQEKIRQIISEAIPRKGVQKDCAYLGSASERFCRMTTNKNCQGCKFYEPNMYGKIHKIIEYVVKKETEHASELAIWQHRYQDKLMEAITANTRMERYRTLGSVNKTFDHLGNIEISDLSERVLKGETRGRRSNKKE